MTLGNSVVIMVSVFPACGHATLTWIAKMRQTNVAVVFNILCCATSLALAIVHFIISMIFDLAPAILKVSMLLLLVTLPTAVVLYKILNSFIISLSGKFVTKLLLEIPPHLKRVATLP